MNINELLGKTLVSVTGAAKGEELITFVTVCGKEYTMQHHQDCCEYVNLEDVVGDVQDLLEGPITEAEEVSNGLPDKKESDESGTWTFYKLGTRKGSVTLRWYGTSNGYYSEGVDFEQVPHGG